MKTATTPAGEPFMISLLARSDEGERLLAREPVTHGDLMLVRDETWLSGMRAGVLGPELSRLAMSVLPGESRGADHMAGFSIELRDNDRSFRRLFGVSCLVGVSRRAALRLVEQGQIGLDDTYVYRLGTVRPDPAVDNAVNATDMQFTHRVAPPVFESASLASYMENSAPASGLRPPDADNDDVPVFIRQEDWEQGRQLARRGGERESAAAWVGRLMRDTQSPAIFLVIDACLEAEHATEEKYAVTFTGDTWARLRDVLEARRRRLQRPHERILGSVHGHNFMPEADDNGRRMCEQCATAKFCSRTTAVASTADLHWHRTVFAGQPWALLLVWGFNAREQDDCCLYGLRDGSLEPRTIRILHSAPADNR